MTEQRWLCVTCSATIDAHASPLFRERWLCAKGGRLCASCRGKLEAVGCDRKCVGRRRNDLGLPRICGRKGDKWPKQLRTRFKASVKSWLAKHDVNTLAELRVKKFREFAAESGWPTDLPVRCVMILNLLAGHGVPMHRRQICEGIGLTWHGSRRSMKCKGEHGSYLAILVARDLVVRLGRVIVTRGKGKSVYLYTLGPEALRILQERANGQQN